MSQTLHTSEGFPPLSPPMRDVLDALYAEYGRPEPEREEDILATLIATILSQSTNNANSDRAFGELVDRFEGDWGQVQRAPVRELAEAIAIGGLSNQKAPRIQAILERVEQDFGEHSLEGLRELELKQATAYLLALKGVGPKTASFVLMRAAGMPLFAMDTHILRLCRRLGWITRDTSDARAHALMLPHIPEGEHDPAHVVMIWHGRQTCHARTPACHACPLSSCCAYHARHLLSEDSP